MRVCLLIDARHGLKPNDLEVMEMLGKAAVSYQVVLTKTDLVKAPELEARLAAIHDALRDKLGAMREIIKTSSRKSDGIAELRATLAKLALQEPLGQHHE
jgi:GTP-binding protein